MIDLHIHTKHSDGSDITYDVLKKAQALGLEMISITDHNSVDAYKEIAKWKGEVSYLYKGLIMKGCEFTTSFEGYIIDVLGYHFDVEDIDAFLEANYSLKEQRKNNEMIKDKLLEIFEQDGLVFHRKNIRKKPFRKYYPIRQTYEEIIKYEENKTKIKEDILDSFSDFCRKGLYNPQSHYFVDKTTFFPSIETVIEAIHKAGGIAILAHPYQYDIPKTEDFIDRIMALTKLDGLECFYTTFSQEQMQYLQNYCQKYQLLMSGGSDYHGKNKENHQLGIGRGNLQIPKSIVTEWIEKANKEGTFQGRFLD